MTSGEWACEPITRVATRCFPTKCGTMTEEELQAQEDKDEHNWPMETCRTSATAVLALRHLLFEVRHKGEGVLQKIATRGRDNGIHTLGYLELEIHSARGLTSVQSNGADPFVVVQQAARPSIPGMHHRGETLPTRSYWCPYKSEEESLNPQWKANEG